MPAKDPVFRATKRGRTDEAGGCYACVLPCGVLALGGLAAFGGIVYAGLWWLRVL
jgi:hypothetical protein